MIIICHRYMPPCTILRFIIADSNKIVNIDFLKPVNLMTNQEHV